MNKNERAEKKKALLEPSGVPEKDSRLLHLLEMELTLKAKKFESGGRVDLVLEKEIQKKLLTFVTRCALAAEHYYTKDTGENLAEQFAEKARTFGTESSPLSAFAASPLAAAKLYSYTWDELVKLYALFDERSKLSEAHEQAAIWGDKLKREKKAQRLAKAKATGVLVKLTSPTGGSPASPVLTISTPPELTPFEPVDQANAPAPIPPEEPEATPEDTSSAQEQEPQPKKKRARKKLKDIDATEGEFTMSDDLTDSGTQQAPAETFASASRKKRRKQLLALKQQITGLQDAKLTETPEVPLRKEEAKEEKTKEEEAKEEGTRQEVEGVPSKPRGPETMDAVEEAAQQKDKEEGERVVSMLSPHRPETPVILGPSLPSSMLEDAKHTSKTLEATFSYCVSPSKTGWTEQKVRETTIAVTKGREAQFRSLANEGRAYLTQELIDKWLRVAVTVGAVRIAVRLINEFKANASWSDGEGRSMLHHAVRAGQHAVVEELLNLNADIDAKDSTERTPMHYACMLGDSNCATILMAAGCCVLDEDSLENAPIRYAMGSKMRGVAALLTKRGALRNLYGDMDDTARLLAACRKGHEDVAVLLLEHTPADLSYCSEATPLHYAALNEMVEMVTKLLLSGVAIDPISTDGLTPLHMASYSTVTITRILLNNNAEPGIEDSHGNIALHYACKGKQQEVAQLLVSRATRYIDHRNHSGITPLHQAVSEGLLEIVQLLIAKGALINCKDNVKNTPLHLACSGGVTDCAAALIHTGALLDVKNHSGYEPLIYACSNCMSDIAVQLLAHQCNMNVCDREGLTALHYACANGLEMLCWELLKLPKLDACAKSKTGLTTLHLAAGSNLKVVAEQLLLRGCNINAIDKKGNTALHYACLHQSPECAEYLMSVGADPHVPNRSGDTPLDYAALASGPEVKYSAAGVSKMLGYAEAVCRPGANPGPIVTEETLNKRRREKEAEEEEKARKERESVLASVSSTPFLVGCLSVETLTSRPPSVRRKKVSIIDINAPDPPESPILRACSAASSPVEEVQMCTEGSPPPSPRRSPRRSSIFTRRPTITTSPSGLIAVASDLCSALDDLDI